MVKYPASQQATAFTWDIRCRPSPATVLLHLYLVPWLSNNLLSVFYLPYQIDSI